MNDHSASGPGPDMQRTAADDELVEQLLADARDVDATSADATSEDASRDGAHDATGITASDRNRADRTALEATVAALALAAPAHAATAGDPVRARLLARARAEAETTRVTAEIPVMSTGSAAPPVAASPVPVSSPAEPPRLSVERDANPSRSTRQPERGRGAWWVAGLASLAAAASLLLALRMQTDRSALQSTLASVEASEEAARRQLDSLAEALTEREQQLASVTGPDVAVVELASTASLPPTARMFWDRTADRWTFVANNLASLNVDRTYALWLVTKDGQKILAGNFAPAAQGVAVVRATYALSRTALAAVAVTEEPAEGVPQPTGPILLVGSAGSAPE